MLDDDFFIVRDDQRRGRIFRRLLFRRVGLGLLVHVAFSCWPTASAVCPVFEVLPKKSAAAPHAAAREVAPLTASAERRIPVATSRRRPTRRCAAGSPPC